MSTKEEREMELLSAYIDGELEEAEKNKVTSFLLDSPEGRKALERLKHTKSLLMASPAVQAPHDFLDLLEAQAEKTLEKQKGQVFWRWGNPWAWVPSFGLAAAAACVLAIGLRTPHQIPFETLMAVHENVQGHMGLHQQVVGASHYSSQV